MAVAILFGLLIGPPVLLYLLKSNPSAVFLSLTAGVTLQSLAAQKINDFLDSQHIAFLTTDYRNIVLVALPFLLATALFSGTLKKSKVLVHVVPALCAGALLAFALVPLLPPVTATQIATSDIWKQAQQVQPAVIIIGVVTSIIGLMLSLPKTKKDDKKHH